jgi:mRNA-degrading endonuclease RelE of RelBE toxin-antitoxin system
MRAYRRLHRLTREDRGSDRRVEQRTETLRTRKLASHDDYRIRVGDYRIVYAVDDQGRESSFSISVDRSLRTRRYLSSRG